MQWVPTVGWHAARVTVAPVSKSLTDLTCTLMTGWLDEGSIPDQAVEGVGPRLATAFETKPDDLLLESFLDPEGDWSGAPVEFADAFDGAFSFIAPDRWDGLAQEGNVAQLAEDGEVRLSVVLVPIDEWGETLEGYFERHDVEGLWFAPRHSDIYLHWAWVTGGEDGAPWWVWSVNSSGDWIVLTKGDATDRESLSEQLSVALSSNPWAGWIGAAQAQE